MAADLSGGDADDHPGLDGEGVPADASVAERIGASASRLTASERRVAEVVLDDLKIVAFGTVAQLATRSGTSGPTVLRFASKLGFGGFADLQAAAQAEIVDALRPATERIRERPPSDVVSRVLAGDLANVRTTLEAVDADDYRGAVDLLADRHRRVLVLAGEVARGVGIVFVTQLDLLREGVVALGGSPVRIARQLADVHAGDVVVAIDHRRYERWLLDALERAREAGAEVIAVTDRTLSPLTEGANRAFVVSARGVGPFDSHVGTLALLQALAAGVASRLRRSATERLDAVEAAWSAGQELVEGA
jgi:DNA-binding MurR/RpiR family transcriptional regulator